MEEGEGAEEGTEEIRRLTFWEKVQFYFVYAVRTRQVPLLCLPIIIPIYIVFTPFILIYYCVGYLIGGRYSSQVASEDDPAFVEYISGLGGGWNMATDGATVARAELVQSSSRELQGEYSLSGEVYVKTSPDIEETQVVTVEVPRAAQIEENCTYGRISRIAPDEPPTSDLGY